jgi:ankyrin repeat protein
VKLLLDKGAQPNFEDEDGNRPLSRAIEKGSVAVVQLLLAKEAKMDFRYNTVSKHHPISMSLLDARMMADNVIFDRCRL